ncbi:unnamed protein product [Amaranthus hypochondriacus]
MTSRKSNCSLITSSRCQAAKRLTRTLKYGKSRS